MAPQPGEEHTLLAACVRTIAKTTYWRVQRRQIEALPPDLADQLLAALLAEDHRVAPAQLGAFRESVTRLAVRCWFDGPTGSQWLAFAAGCSALCSLDLRAARKIADPFVHALAGRAATLRSLRLEECKGASVECLSDTLAQLTALTHLHLDGATVATAPPSLPSLTGLASLSLCGVRLGEAGRAALSRLTELHVLTLPWCPDMDDDAARELGVLPRLRHLDLSCCGCHAPPLCPSLTALVMDGCALDIEGETSELVWVELASTLPALAALELNGAKLAGRGVELLEDLVGGAPHLTRLGLAGVALPRVAFLRAATALRSLDMTRENDRPVPLGIEDVASALRAMPLEALCLGGAWFGDQGARSLAALTGLRELHLHGACRLDTPEFLAVLRLLPRLRVAGMWPNPRLPSTPPPRGLDGLAHLQLHQMREADAAALPSLAPELVELEAGAAFGDEGVAHVAALTRLTRLALHDLQGMVITDEGLGLLTALTALESLKLMERMERPRVPWAITKPRVKALAQQLPCLRELSFCGMGLAVPRRAPEGGPEPRAGAKRGAALTPEVLRHDERRRYGADELRALAGGGAGAPPAKLPEGLRGGGDADDRMQEGP